jgi:DNA-binding transcriptional ArsR family regulator
MRPPVQRQSALRAPLNDVFGTEGAVRLLRVLTMESTPMSVGVLAKRTRLDRSAARRALGALVDSGLVDARGAGRAPHYTLRHTHPHSPAITALFEAEHRRAEAVLDGIKGAVRRLSPPPTAVWLEGAAATEADEPGEPLLVRVVAPAPSLRETVDSLRQALGPLEQALDVPLELSGATPADLASRRELDRQWQLRLRDARSLGGLPPTAFLPRPSATAHADRPEGRVRTHANLDERGLAIAEAIARRLRGDPTLVARALELVEHRLANASAHERHELEEWAQLLRTASPARLRRFLVDRGERATRLRQTLPFLGVLTPGEREALLADVAEAEPGGDT